jgi:hypothetical protein
MVQQNQSPLHQCYAFFFCCPFTKGSVAFSKFSITVTTDFRGAATLSAGS